VKKRDTSAEEIIRQGAISSGPQARIPEKTAEALGERLGNAYSDPESVAQTQKGTWVYRPGLRKAVQAVLPLPPAVT
jgi:hypothetical protein